MVTDSIRSRRDDDRSPTDRPDRGQVILIGAVALAFIILGVVVIFNGVVYTETLSSADTGQSASSAETTELEVRQGIACLIAEDDDGNSLNLEDDSDLEPEIEEYEELYRNATSNSQPAVVEINPENGGTLDPDVIIGHSLNVTITYNSTDLSYEREIEIDSTECPSS